MHIRRFEVRGDVLSGDEIRLTGGGIWAQLEGDGEGEPDGMKVDSEGNVFCCGPGGVHVFSPEGRCLGVVLVPEVVANFNWGDDDHKTLYMCATTGLYSCRASSPADCAAGPGPTRSEDRRYVPLDFDGGLVPGLGP